MLLIIAFVLLGLAAVGFFYRLLVGPSVGDRVIALDGLVLIAISSLAVDAALTERTILVDVMVVVGLLGFVGTSVAARYIEGSDH